MSKENDKYFVPDIEDEIWKVIPDFEECYHVSNLGRIKSLSRKVKCGNKYGTLSKRVTNERLKVPFISNVGYLIVELKYNCSSKKFLIHKLVAENFIANPFNLSQINHRDGDKLNNQVVNLEWCTPNDNMKHSYDINLRKASNKKSIESIDINNKILEFESISEASRKLNLNRACVSDVLRNKQSQTGGYKFRYILKLLKI